MFLNRCLVPTKFTPPRLGASPVVRKQLLGRLHSGRHCKLTLVAASAGFGKTVLLAQWRQELAAEGCKVAWLSLSADEPLRSTFQAHLFAALASLGLPIGEEASVEAVVSRLATTEEDLYLILDDYHHVEDPAAHALVQTLVELSPANFHVAIGSRVLPPLGVGRRRVMGQMSEIACNDLLFDLSETRAFLEGNFPAPGLSADQIEQIHELTCGWPACLQLTSLMLQSRSDRRGALGDLSWLQTYISENVLSQVPVELVRFMESLSICRQFNAELAATVSGAPNAGAMLRSMEDSNLLIMRAESDDGSLWFRFHPLFAGFLSAQLLGRGPEAVEQLHRRAGAWYAKKDLIQDAVTHACRGGDLKTAAATFEAAAAKAWGRMHFGPMLWAPFEATKDQSLRERFLQSYFPGIALAMEGRFGEAHQLHADNPAPADKRDEVLALNTDRNEIFWLLFEGRIREAEKAASAIYARAVAAHGHRSPCAELCIAPLAEILFELNKVDEARKLLTGRPHIFTGAPATSRIFAVVCKARLELLQGAEDDALALLDNQAAKFAAIGFDRGVAHVVAEQVRIHVAAGRRRPATEGVERLAKVNARVSDVFRGEIAGETGLASARLLALDGEHDAALDTLARVRAQARRMARGRKLVTVGLVAARVLDAAGRPEEASAHVVAAMERAASHGLVRTILQEGEGTLEVLARLRAGADLSSEASAHVDLLLGGGTATPSGVRAAGATVSPRQLQILRLAATGMSNKRIALALNITPETVKWNLKGVYSRLKVSSRYDAMTWARGQGLIA